MFIYREQVKIPLFLHPTITARLRFCILTLISYVSGSEERHFTVQVFLDETWFSSCSTVKYKWANNGEVSQREPESRHSTVLFLPHTGNHCYPLKTDSMWWIQSRKKSDKWERREDASYLGRWENRKKVLRMRRVEVLNEKRQWRTVDMSVFACVIGCKRCCMCACDVRDHPNLSAAQLNVTRWRVRPPP